VTVKAFEIGMFLGFLVSTLLIPLLISFKTWSFNFYCCSLVILFPVKPKKGEVIDPDILEKEFYDLCWLILVSSSRYLPTKVAILGVFSVIWASSLKVFFIGYK
jgi:hypothetical protein